MAVRSDVAVDFTVSPRVATVAQPSATITIQDLYDTLQDVQSRGYHSVFPILVNGSGKQDLGGGVKVGVTLELQNTKLAFEARSGPTYVQCTVTNGNLVAKDANGNIMNPIQTTDFTQVVLEKSTSASIASNDITAIADAVLDELVSQHSGNGSLGQVVSAIKARTDDLPGGFPRAQAVSWFTFLMVDKADHMTPKSGLAVSGKIQKDGGAFTLLTNAVAEVESGLYKINLTATEMDGALVTLRFYATGSDDRVLTLITNPKNN